MKKDRNGKKVRRVGVMGVVERDGYVEAGYEVWVEEGKGKLRGI